MNFFRSIKENLKDPKKKSLTLLGIYIVFFIFVFAVISMGSTPTYIREDDDTTNKNTQVINSYEYIYKIQANENTIEIKGTLKDLDQIFNYNGLNYYKSDDNIYLVETNEIQDIDFDIDRYNYQNIDNLIQNSDFIEKTTYKDNSEKTIYNISVDKYFNMLNESNLCDTTDCSLVIVTITVESSDYINYINIDLSNYYNYDYIIEIYYTNINNIEEISVNNN